MTSRFSRPPMLAAVLGLIAAALFSLWSLANAVAKTPVGYKAKIACSETLVAGRGFAQVLTQDFNAIHPAMDLIRVRIDAQERVIDAAGPLRLGRAQAVFRDGYGCTLTRGRAPAPLPALAPTANAPDAALRAVPGAPHATTISALLDEAFAEPASGHRAVVVLHRGAIIAEHYADGFSADTPMQSWSMAKSVVATLIGAAVETIGLDIDHPAYVSDWAADDPRAKITWRHLLAMESGLAFDENYAAPRSDANRMLFSAPSAGAYAAQRPPAYPPGARWSYSSGDTNILARALHQRLAEDGMDMARLAREQVFAPIGAHSFVLEPDAAGVFIGSSFAYATARDWARVGQLYLQDGVWAGRRILPAGWADDVATPAARSDGRYGAHFWLNRDGASGRQRAFPALPETAYFMSGHEGQYTIIMPDDELVMVRLGVTRGRDPVAVSRPLIDAIYRAVASAS